jgi:hypothetical protein
MQGNIIPDGILDAVAIDHPAANHKHLGRGVGCTMVDFVGHDQA